MLIEQALTRPVLTVIAGPGYGKSMAIYSYLRESSSRTIWVQLSERDNAPAHFWETFMGAVASFSQELAATMLASGFPHSDEMRGYLAEAFRGEFQSRCHSVFVFDDLHLLADGPVLDLIIHIINTIVDESRESRWSAVIMARRDCLPNATGLSRAGVLSRLDEAELSFTKSELQEFFELRGVAASHELVTSIYRDTEGLPFAVALAARILEENSEDGAYVRTALKGNFNRMIDERLFSVISDELKHFLLKLSLVKHLSPELIDSLGEGLMGGAGGAGDAGGSSDGAGDAGGSGSGDGAGGAGEQGTLSGQEAMDRLVDASSLIRYDRYMHVYRIHHLLQRYLEGRQHMLTEAERQEVYGRAARWCEANGYRIDALAYYRAMGDYDAIVRMSFGYSLVIPYDIATELLAAMEQAPQEVFESNPGARILYPRLITTVGRVDEGQALTRSYITLFKARPPNAGNHRTLMGLYNNYGFAEMLKTPETHDYRFYRHFEAALGYADTAARAPASGNLIYSVGPYALRVGRAKAGDPEACIEAVRRSVRCTRITLRGCMYGLDSLMASEYAYFRGLSAEAESQALLCVAQAREYGQREIEIRALYLLLRVYLQTGKCERLTNTFSQLGALMDDKRFINRYLLHEIISSWFFASIGEVGRVENWLKSDLWSSGLNEHVSGLDDFTKQKYYLAIKDYGRLLAFVESRSSRLGVARFIIGKVGLAVAHAVCHQKLGDREAALDWLQRAYELARPNELWMPFIEMGNAMRSLASFALKEGAAGDVNAGDVSAGAGAGAGAAGAAGAGAGDAGAEDADAEGATGAVPAEWLRTIRSRATTYAKRVAFVRSRYLEARSPETNVQLTAKELEILANLAHGLSRTELAVVHGISINTVKTMLQMIYDKLGAESAMDAVRIATTRHLL